MEGQKLHGLEEVEAEERERRGTGNATGGGGRGGVRRVKGDHRTK